MTLMEKLGLSDAVKNQDNNNLITDGKPVKVESEGGEKKSKKQKAKNKNNDGDTDEWIQRLATATAVSMLLKKRKTNHSLYTPLSVRLLLLSWLTVGVIWFRYTCII